MYISITYIGLIDIAFASFRVLFDCLLVNLITAAMPDALNKT